MKEFADDNFKFNENARKLSKWVENTVGKEEIAHYKQFLLFPQCFQKACFPGASKGVTVWEWVKMVFSSLIGLKTVSFSCNAFKRLSTQGRYKSGLCVKGLSYYCPNI